MSGLKFDSVKSPAHEVVLREIAERVWRRDDVVAIWIGGSIARGNADRYSDIDLRVAVKLSALSTWEKIDLAELLGRDVVGSKRQGWAEGAMLHHLLLASGEIVDLFVQAATRENPEDAIAVLACRDEQLAERIAKWERAAPISYHRADADEIRRVIVEFWINTHKHRKVLARGIDLLVLTGLQFDRAALVRLWYVWLTGNDCGNRRPSIFEMSEASGTVQKGIPQAMDVIGMSAENREELCRATERVRDEVANVGRKLSTRLGFEYPDELEKTVRIGWSEFLDEEPT